MRIFAWLQALDPQPASPSLLAVNALLGLVILAIIAAGCMGWSMALTRLFSGQRLLPHEPRRNVPWGLVDLIAVFALLLLTTLLAQGVMLYAGVVQIPKKGEEVAPSGWMLAADAVTKFLSLAAVALFIRARQPLSLSDLGFRSDRLRADCFTGLIAFCMLAPLVFGIQFLLVQWWPSSHPLIEMLQKTPSPGMFALTCFSAVIVAPLSEEFAFRVLLQGWLEKIAQGNERTDAILLGGHTPPEPPAIVDLDRAASAEPGTARPIAPVDYANPYAPPPALSAPEKLPTAEPLEHTEPSRLWPLPILVSALVFSLLHWSHGPDWVPLSVLGVGLGYLYQRTHRATPSIVVHFLLNSLSMIGVGLQVFLLPQSV
jgi:membrane protease YdiL (CAAX protease family)